MTDDTPDSGKTVSDRARDAIHDPAFAATFDPDDDADPNPAQLAGLRRLIIAYETGEIIDDDYEHGDLGPTVTIARKLLTAYGDDTLDTASDAGGDNR